MAIAIRAKRGLTRRQLLVRSAATAALAGLGGLARPYLSRVADRPQITSGLASGDVSGGSAVVWSKADRRARMQVECATAEGFKTILRATSSEALPEHDFASKVLLEGLPPGQDIFYRVRFEDIAERECRERPASACEVSSGAAYFNHGMGIFPNLTKRNNEVRFFSMSHCVCYCDQDFQGEAER